MAKSRVPLDDKRRRLLDRIEALGADMNQLSAKAGRNHSYIQQYINYATPRWLPEDVRKVLSRELRMREEDIGVRPLPVEKAANRKAPQEIDLSMIPANIDLALVQQTIAETLELAARRNIQIDSRRTLATAIRVAAKNAGRKPNRRRTLTKEALDCIFGDKCS